MAKMQLSKSDQRIISLLDIAVDRLTMTRDICDALERLRLYYEHIELLEAIDRAFVLLYDLKHLLWEDYHRARMRLSEGLVDQLNKLSPEGLDAYWTNGRSELLFDLELFPWRD
jgi:hypothetical protein